MEIGIHTFGELVPDPHTGAGSGDPRIECAFGRADQRDTLHGMCIPDEAK